MVLKNANRSEEAARVDSGTHPCDLFHLYPAGDFIDTDQTKCTLFMPDGYKPDEQVRLMDNTVYTEYGHTRRARRHARQGRVRRGPSTSI